MRGPQNRTILARGALVLASLALVLSLGEGAARFYWKPRSPILAHEKPTPEPGMTTFATLTDLARPNVRGIYRGVLHETNDRGIRGPARAGYPEPGVVRIGITGDSVTMGSGVEERDTYVVQLEQMLATSHPEDPESRRFEVLNLGLSGVNAQAAMQRLTQLDRDYHLDIVVYGFTPNDIEGPHYERTSTALEQLARFNRIYELRQSPSYLVRSVGPSLRSVVERIRGSPGSLIGEIAHNYFENPPAAADFERALDVFAEAARARRGCGLVFLHTPLSELGWLSPWGPVSEHVERLARDRGLAVIETFPSFAGRDEPSLWVGPMDPHPNALGHRLLAEALYAGLDELPAHCLAATVPTATSNP